MSHTPIGDHALLSDCRSAALTTIGGSIDWLCFPRFDRPSVFGRLLGDAAGHWSIAPTTAPTEVTRRYLDRSMVLETTIRTATGVFRLTEAMALDPDERGHDLGKGAPGALLRKTECLEGSVDLTVEFAPRPEYGLIHPLLARVDAGITGRGGADVFALSIPPGVEPRIDGSTATSISRSARASRSPSPSTIRRRPMSPRACGDRRRSRRSSTARSRRGGGGPASTRRTRDHGRVSSITPAACSSR
jgi:hypothetical protein